MTALFSGDRTQTHQETLERAMRAAAGFQAMGLTADNGVGVMLRNDFAFFESSRGATFAGAFSVPINWHFKGDEVRYILENSSAKALVIHADLLPQVDGAVPDDVKVLVVETPPEIAAAYGVPSDVCAVPAGATNWDTWLMEHEPLSAPAPASRGAMFYTSGTTGKPKGVKRGEMNVPEMMMIMMKASAEAWGFTRQDLTALIPAPLYHSAVSGYASGTTGLGANTVLMPKFDAEEFLRLVEKHKISHAITVPTMFVRLLALPDDVKKKYDLSSLEFITHGAAPCSPEVKKQMLDWLGPVVHEYFGGTEIGLVTAAAPQDSIDRPGTVGKALSGAEIRIYDEDGNLLQPGEIGEVYIGMKGMPDFTYHGMDEKRAEIGRDGLVCIGDIGYMDEDGFLFLCDRKIEMVISGGVNIYPAEIESELVTMPGVADCAVFGIPDAEFGESLCAHIIRQPGADIGADDVKAFLRDRLAGYKVPKVVEFTDELPREDSGKIYKRKLREPYWEGQERRI